MKNGSTDLSNNKIEEKLETVDEQEPDPLEYMSCNTISYKTLPSNPIDELTLTYLLDFLAGNNQKLKK